MDDHTHCLYRSKPCFNQRSRKNDGSLHRFCTLHRAKANDAQRRWHARKRDGHRRSLPSQPDGSSSSSGTDDAGDTGFASVKIPRLSCVSVQVTSHAAMSSGIVLGELAWVPVPVPSTVPRLSLEDCGLPVDDLFIRFDHGDLELDEIIVDDEYLITGASCGTST